LQRGRNPKDSPESRLGRADVWKPLIETAGVENSLRELIEDLRSSSVSNLLIFNKRDSANPSASSDKDEAFSSLPRPMVTAGSPR